MGLSIESPAFANNGFIPVQYTCDGADSSPPLLWKDAPVQTKSYVLIVDDPDAPAGTWVHWVLFNIPADVKQLNGSGLPAGAESGKNSWGKVGYGGPCPPSGTHRYFFKLYALDTVLTLTSSANKQDVLKAMQNHVLESSELIGLYSRKS
ncbi:Phosphatidylethanolamine-binding protein [Legionella lansingensis]|uniref:Phosphatidylethanolamine-binding protein n=1 Tax=Legionella lansingensis TaxID=45067 RepID=A0A0W0VP90_9GAMM|nr:YbhB/YbcL family Raf kinase inhibitor-like protein [Legionella lansingensis]KTD21953.1 Phosphatidylethanolamine-binding protein [Legionella lansingensis]SNV46088.1 Phosphatidylethanolamine-binding protein [Legionella lansingensis]